MICQKCGHAWHISKPFVEQCPACHTRSWISEDLGQIAITSIFGTEEKRILPPDEVIQDLVSYLQTTRENDYYGNRQDISKREQRQRALLAFNYLKNYWRLLNVKENSIDQFLIELELSVANKLAYAVVHSFVNAFSTETILKKKQDRERIEAELKLKRLEWSSPDNPDLVKFKEQYGLSDSNVGLPTFSYLWRKERRYLQGYS